MKTYQQNENQYYTGCRAKLTAMETIEESLGFVQDLEDISG